MRLGIALPSFQPGKQECHQFAHPASVHWHAASRLQAFHMQQQACATKLVSMPLLKLEVLTPEHAVRWNPGRRDLQ
jgi:hypothetical protein